MICSYVTLNPKPFPKRDVHGITAPLPGALGRAPAGRCSPSGRHTRRFSGSIMRDNDTYREPCAKTGSGMYTATRPLHVCPCDLATVIANATQTGNWDHDVLVVSTRRSSRGAHRPTQLATHLPRARPPLRPPLSYYTTRRGASPSCTPCSRSRRATLDSPT